MSKKYVILFLLLLLSNSTFAKIDCSVSDMELNSIMNLTYSEFDQNPSKGWRVFARKDCNKKAIELIEAYLDLHNENLLTWQKKMLTWHAGQLYAFISNYKKAIMRFRLNINPGELPDDTFKWNAYVRGSIAFLEKDASALKKEILLLEKATNPNSKTNLAILKSLKRCFNRSYKEAYNQNCK